MHNVRYMSTTCTMYILLTYYVYITTYYVYITTYYVYILLILLLTMYIYY